MNPRLASEVQPHLATGFAEGSALRSESESHSVVSDSLRPHGLYSPWNSPSRNTGVGSLSLLQGNLPNPGIKLALAGRFFTTAPAEKPPKSGGGDGS